MNAGDGAEQPSGYLARMTRAAVLLTASGSIVWPFDAALQLLTRPGGTLQAWLCAAGLLALVSLLAAAAFTPLVACLPARWLAGPSPRLSARGAVSAVVQAALTALGGLLVAPLLTSVVPRSLAYPQHVAGVIAPYVVGGLVLGVERLLRRRGAPAEAGPFAPLLCLAAAYLVAAPHLSEVIGRYASHYEFVVLGLALLASANLSRGLSGRFVRTASVATFAAGVAAFAAVTALSGPRAAMFAQYPRLGQVSVATALLFDLDRDGMPAVLGGSDCDDLDARVNPLMLELVGNGVDDNCMGGDLATYTAPPSLGRLATPPSHDVIFVTLDAARADLLNARNMPRLFARSQDYAVFTRAYANSNHTTASLLSMLTGQFVMGAQTSFHDMAGTEPPLPRLLHSVGYHTLFAFQAAFSNQNVWIGETWFDEVDRKLAPLNAADAGATSTLTTEHNIALVEKLSRAKKPFFAWLHYLDMHEQYMPRPSTPFPGDSAKARYFQEAFSVDRDLDVFVQALEARGYFERGGMLVIHGDHGEIVEPGRTGHATFLDEGVLRVPLLLRGPGVKPGRYDTRVNLVDLYPTALGLAAGISAPAAGRSLSRIWNRGDHTDEPIIAVSFYDGNHLSAVIDGHEKLVRDLRLGIEALYDLKADPNERHDLSDERPASASRLRDQLGRAWDLSFNDRVLERRGVRRVEADR